MYYSSIKGVAVFNFALVYIKLPIILYTLLVLTQKKKTKTKTKSQKLMNQIELKKLIDKLKNKSNKTMKQKFALTSNRL
jgi:hypothetical protein